MNSVQLNRQVSELSYMFMTSEMIINKFVNTGNPEQKAAAKVLIEAERERLRETFTTLQNNLSAEFFAAMNKINVE